jgi:hypothetical protein
VDGNTVAKVMKTNFEKIAAQDMIFIFWPSLHKTTIFKPFKLREFIFLQKKVA